MTDLREMTLLELAKRYDREWPQTEAIDAELSRRQSMLTAADQLHKLVTDYLSWDLSAAGKQHAVERWKESCRKALSEYNAAKGTP